LAASLRTERFQPSPCRCYKLGQLRDVGVETATTKKNFRRRRGEGFVLSIWNYGQCAGTRKRTEIMVDTAAMNTPRNACGSGHWRSGTKARNRLIRLPVWMLDSWKKPRRYLNRLPTN
jgi:hypothetical protein